MPTADKFEWGQGNPLFEVMFRAVSEGLFGNGVLSAGDLQVTIGTGDLEVDVAPGRLWYSSSVEEVTETTLTLSAGDGSNDRWDTIYYDAASSTVDHYEGTPGEYPEPPALSGEEFPLAFVYVPQSSTAIVSGNILNWRAWGTHAENVRYNDDTNTVQSGLDDARSRLNTAESDIDSAETRLDSAETRLDDAEGRLDTAETDIDSAETRLDDAEGRLDTAESDITSAETRLDDAEGRLDTAESDIDSAETRLDDAEGRLDTTESDVSTLDERLDIDGVHVTHRSELPDPANMDRATIGYIDDEDRYVGVFQQ